MGRGSLWTFLIALLCQHANAQRLVAGTYVGHPPAAKFGGCGESIWIDADGERIWFAKYGELEARSDKEVLREDGTVWVRFSPYVLFRGRASKDGLRIKGRLVVTTLDRDYIAVVRPYVLRATQVPGHVTLSGITVCSADTNGSATIFGDRHGGTAYGNVWNTLGGYPFEDAWKNIYVFTNRHGKPFFLNGGDSDSSLHPNVVLAPGTYTLHFAGAPGPLPGFMAINLYFNNSTTGSITAYVPVDGSEPFGVVPAGVRTWEQYYGSRPSSGSLSFSVSNLTVTLMDLRVETSSRDLVSGACARPDGAADTTGTFTLRVTAE